MKCQFVKRARFILLMFGAFVFASLPGAQVVQAESTCLLHSWPSESSDLQPDPSLTRGVLQNGLRFVLRKNSEPKNRVVLYLLVNAGSFNEKSEQRGVAHFLEHMMFNGTENYPPGSLIDYFQSIGMSFGGDTNAFTTFDRTVFNIVLPDGNEKELNTGLQVLSDFAGRALLLEKEINKERGVILAEKRDRDSAEYRTYVASNEYAFKGTLLPERQVIGVDETLQKADRAILKDFYDTWYRPDNMALVVVGDFDVASARKLIEKNFGALLPRKQTYQCPDYGSLGTSTRQPFYHYERELGKTEVSIEKYWDTVPVNDSRALQREELLKFLSELIINYRLEKMEADQTSPFTRGSYYSGDLTDRIGYAVLSTQAKNEKWQQSLQTIETLRKQLLAFGVLPDELDRAKKQIRTELETSVKTERTKDSREIARGIVDHLAENRVYLSATQDLAMYGEMLDKLDVADVNDQFHDDWAKGNTLVSVTGDTALIKPASGEIAAAYELAGKTAPQRPDAYGKIDFPYLDVPESHMAAPATTHWQETGITRYVFANGLIVNLKKTDFEDKNIRINATFGNGELSEPQPGMALLAEQVINESGTKRLTQTELSRLVAGTTVSLGFHINESSFAWGGQSLQTDFPFLVQVLYSLIYDHGFRESAFQNAMVKVDAMYSKLKQDINGAFPLQIQKFIAGNSERFGLPSYDKMREIKYDTLSHWVAGWAEPKNLEISVVGDFSEGETVALLAKYFGGREFTTKTVTNAPAISFPEGKRLNLAIPTAIDKSLVVVAWPTADGSDIKRSRRMHVLAAILEDRLIEKLRESLGATYSPESYSFASRTYKDYGYLLAEMIVEPDKAQAIAKEVLALADEIVQSGITDEELIRARDPIVTSIKELVQTNGYWLNSVLTLSSRYPEQLKWPQTILDDYASINKDEITVLAKQFLNDNRAATAIAAPRKSATRAKDLTAVATP